MDSDNAYIYATGNTPVEQVDLSTGTVSYLVADMLGSVRGIIDSSDGTLTASAEYDAWGNPETSGGLTAYTPLGYGGSYSDPTGLVYLTNRYYDPMTGQFLTVDPLVDKTDQAYAYADDNPVVSTDLLGLSCGLFSVGDCLQDAIGYGTHEIEEHAGGIAAATSTAAIVLSFTGVGEPLVPILEGVSAVTGSLGSGKDLAEGNYATAVLDFGGAALGAGGFSLGQLAARLDAGGPALNDAVDELAETIAGGEGTSIDQEELASLIQARRDLRLLAEERQGQGATADVYAAALALVGLC
jgi:RHS repeat-associated protein